MVDQNDRFIRNPAGSYRRVVDQLVGGLTATLVVMVIGIYGEIAYLTYFALPVVLCLFLMLPCLKNSGERTVASALVAGFSALMLVIMAFIAWGEESARTIWGMPAGGALFLFVLWPYTVVVGGFLYAVAYQSWLRFADVGPERGPIQRGE